MHHAIARVAGPEDLEAVRGLFTEYHAWLGEVVCSQRLADEIASLPGPYDPPRGALLVARNSAGEPAGCVGVRQHEGDTAEMKRLYVRPEDRGTGLGRRLAVAAIGEASAIGYRRLVLTTLPDTMDPAVRLYTSLGFRPSNPFRDFSHVHAGVDMLFMEIALGS